jgi:hypothetical protein
MGAERWAFFLRFRMNAAHFDRFTRLLADPGFPRTISWDVEPGLSRRAFIAGALAFLRLGGNRDTAAGPACKNVGRRCQRARQCCSGICRGGKRKRCKAHDSGGCRAGQQSVACGGEDVACTSSSGLPGLCETTTGRAEFCFASGDCFPCQKDADCRGVCGPRAACVRCAATCSGVGGTACVGPDACDFS